MKIHCLVHLEFETLGNITDWACSRNYPLSLTMPSENSVYPECQDFDLLIIMGGLMSVYQEDEYPWLKKEKEFVKSALNSGKNIYGICFGAQMISELLGGKVCPGEFKEIGWHRVRSLNAFQKNASLVKVPDEFTVFQWHGDTFSLPEGATRLFESEACAEQGFIHGSNVLAVQFHPETDRQCAENLLLHCCSDLTEGRYIQQEEKIRENMHFADASAELMSAILDWFDDKVKAVNK